MAPLWPSPAFKVIEFAPAAVKVRTEKPGAVAVTELAPPAAPSVSVVTARPPASVVEVVPERLPPPPVSAQVTGKPARAAPLKDVALTTNGLASAVLDLPDWRSPQSFTTADAAVAGNGTA